MLFGSGEFIFGFLPAFLLGFFILGVAGWRRAAVCWALIGSLVFYGWNDPLRLLPIILSSIAFNFLVANILARRRSGWLLLVGISGNLALLIYFKYAMFLLGSFNAALGLTPPTVQIYLPIGISFYTFTQIAFLVDTYQDRTREYEPLKYGLFVSFFPHLIAGPIIHHKEIMPQFERDEIYTPSLEYIIPGLTWFAIGLFKKVVLADNVARFVGPVFKAAANGMPVGPADAWIGTASYALQIYFDFSGYSDMAIGLALMMGIRFPLNFDSPYKAVSLIDFWRRWHMTLSRFLRDYLYIPLGGSRRGEARRYANLIVTMLLGGLWHGASWNFFVWGALHGGGLAANHAWRAVADRLGITLPRGLAWLLTMFVVLMAWVPFRAETLTSSLAMWKGMLGLSGALPSGDPDMREACIWIVALSAIALCAPNTQTIMSWKAGAGTDARWKWQPRLGWALALGCLFGVAVAGSLTKTSYFLYFRF